MPKPFVDKCVECNGCWSSSRSPMIHNELWTGIGMKQGLLCDRCFRKRLDRPLRAADLTECPFNDQFFVLAAVVKMLHGNKWAVSTNKRQARFVAAARRVLDSSDVIPDLNF